MASENWATLSVDEVMEPRDRDRDAEIPDNPSLSERETSLGNRAVNAWPGSRTILSLIPFGIVALTIVGALFGAGVFSLIASRGEVAATSAGTHEAMAPHSGQTTLPPQDVASTSPQQGSASPQSTAPKEDISTPNRDRSSLQDLPQAQPSQLDQPSLPRQAMSASSAAIRLPTHTTHDLHRAAHIRFLQKQEARVAQQLTKPNLSSAETRRLERRKAYWARAVERARNAP
jgi:hypothetical protein